MNPSDILKYGQRTMRASLDNVPMDKWDEGGVCGVWSVKNIIAHLISYENWLIETLNYVQHQSDQPLLAYLRKAGHDGFNAQQVSQRESLTPAQILAEFDASYQQVAEIAAQLPADLWSKVGTLPWYGAEYSLDDFVVYTFYGHKREHSAQVDVFKDRLMNS